MAGASIILRIDDAEIMAALKRVQEAGLDPTPLHDDIGLSMVERTQERFLNERDPEGKAWAPHAKSTERRRGKGAQKLRKDMHLYDSLTHNAAEAYVEWGVNRPYAAVHQFGHSFSRMTSRRLMAFRKIKGGKWRFAKKSSKAKTRINRLVQVGSHSITIPARPYLGINEEDRALIVEKVEAYIKRAAEGQ